MAEVGVMAYPVLLATMIGVFRIGRGDAWGILEWLRFATLATLLGLVVAVQVKLAMLGLVHGMLGLALAGTSVAGVGALMGLYLWEKWQRRHLVYTRLSERDREAIARI